MSGLEVAAAVVGVTDVAIRSILTTYELLKDVQDAPTAIAQVREETAAVVHALPGLDFLKTADKDVQALAERVGVAEAVNQCGASCAALNNSLKKWTGTGDSSLGAKLQYVRHRAQVQKCCTQIHTAKGTITLAVSITSYALLARNSSADATKKREQATALEAEISRLQAEAQKQRKDADEAIQDMQKRLAQDDDDLEAELALTQCKEQKGSCEQLWANCLVAEEEVQTLAKVDVVVGDMTAHADSSNFAGVPKEVLKRLAHARVKAGNMVATEGSVNRAGIF